MPDQNERKLTRLQANIRWDQKRRLQKKAAAATMTFGKTISISEILVKILDRDERLEKERNNPGTGEE